MSNQNTSGLTGAAMATTAASRGTERDALLSPAVIAHANMDAIHELSGGNPGAITAICGVIKDYTTIDPKAWGGGHHVIMFLQEQEIKGEKIWALFKYTCGMSTVNFVAVMRAHQLGLLEPHQLKNIKRGDIIELDFPKLIGLIQKTVPEFNQQPIAPKE